RAAFLKPKRVWVARCGSGIHKNNSVLEFGPCPGVEPLFALHMAVSKPKAGGAVVICAGKIGQRPCARLGRIKLKRDGERCVVDALGSLVHKYPQAGGARLGNVADSA